MLIDVPCTFLYGTFEGLYAKGKSMIYVKKKMNNLENTNKINSKLDDLKMNIHEVE